MTSPFDQKTAPIGVIDTMMLMPSGPKPLQTAPVVASINSNPNAVSPFGASAPSSSLDVKMIVGDKEIESLGSDVSSMVAGVANRFTQLNTKKLTSDYGDLGDLLTTVTMQADKLDPANILPKGVVGWAKSKLFSIRHTMLKHLRSAEESFDALEASIANRIAIDDQWVKDYDSLYKDNFKAYEAIMATLNTAQGWLSSMQNTLNNLPAIDPNDPDAVMKSQSYRIAEGRISRLKAKIDSFMRLKVLAENNGPKIHGMQEASLTCIQSLRSVMTEVLPFVRMDFTLYIAALDNKKSRAMVDGARGLANATLVKTADAVGETMVETAKQAATASISNDVLISIRSKMLNAVTQVRAIDQQADIQRAADSKMLQETQAAYLANLTAQGAI